MSDILYQNVIPLNQTLTLNYLLISNMPNFISSPVRKKLKEKKS